MQEVEVSPNLNEIIMHIENAMKVIDKYTPSKPGNIAFTKLEEAILWAQVLVGQIPLKCSDGVIDLGVTPEFSDQRKNENINVV